MDDTKIFMSRLGGYNTNQECCYAGHKRRHCLVYLIVFSPDGLILYMHAPEVGHSHEITLYKQSSLDAAIIAQLIGSSFMYLRYRMTIGTDLFESFFCYSETEFVQHCNE